jgi:uncharacterized FAD-dependent dehydrogenase
MIEVEFALKPEEAFDAEVLRQKALHAISDATHWHYKILKRSIDARSRQVLYRFKAALYEPGEVISGIAFQPQLPSVVHAPEVHIIGTGPAGLFAAIYLIESGLKPILLERGSDVRARRRDLAAINKEHIVNPESNYCFGEGGAGTYSDGKLYTRSHKRGDIQRILEILVAYGSPEDILVDAHPHIGTNKLPKIIESMREAIIAAGGEVHFNTKVIDWKMEGDRISHLITNVGILPVTQVIVATGHSARDIFELFHQKGLRIEAKPFALGVRIEHPQALIDKMQYRCDLRGPYLPAASYALVAQAEWNAQTRGVFSFCMCPGGFIVPAATAPGEVVVNGMSPSRRDSRFANSGLVVALDAEEWPHHSDTALAGLRFQQSIEQKAWLHGGSTQKAPAQRVEDFIQRKTSSSLPETSYQPGLTSADLYEVLPPLISERLNFGLKEFEKKMPGYRTNEAVLVGVESRTSSPVLIPRDKETLVHPQVRNLYPCGEGAGYAGGIVSAAMDGERCAKAIFEALGKHK